MQVLPVRSSAILALASALVNVGCGDASSSDAPPGGWANTAPTSVEVVVDRGEHQLLEVRQGSLTTWVQVPDVGARVGDFVLLGRGEARVNVPIPERALRAPEVVDIEHVRVVDADTASRVTARTAPSGAVSIADVYAQLGRRGDSEVLVFGRVVKAANAVGSYWVHLQDGTGDAANGTHDLTVQTQEAVVEGQWVAFRGTLRRDVDLGFGYHYSALVEGGTRVE
jgi:hypothetical protein